MRSRFTTLLVLASILTFSIGAWQAGVAEPNSAGPGSIPLAQIDPEPDSSPPLIEPEEGAVVTEVPGEDSDELPAIEIGADLGNGGQPDGLPREVTIDGSRFLFDRLVPRSPDLVPIAQGDSLVAFAASDQGPFASIYVAATDSAEKEISRYLPEQVDTPDSACPVEVADIGQLNAGDIFYLFAGLETDITPDALEEVGTSGDQPVYTDPGAPEPYPELFIANEEGLLRFVLAGSDGRPATLSESLAFDATRFAFVADVTGQVDPGALTKLGCAGPYPVFGNPQESEGTVSRYVLTGPQLFEYSGELPQPVEPTEAPTEAPTEEPTAVPTEVPTEEPTEVPTEAPTEVPTEIPTEVPTEAPTEEPTAVPTEVPTEMPPTDVPTEIPTQEPTVVPTEVPPTDVPTEIPTQEPTVAPTEQPTEVPVVVPTDVPSDVPTAAPSQVPTETASPTPVPTQQLQPPAVVPTQAPNQPPPAAVTAVPSTTCPGQPGALDANGIPGNLPSRFQIGGVAYAFAGIQEPAEAGVLTRIGCAGAFEVATTDQAERSEALYLRYTGQGPASQSVYRFEAAITYGVDVEVTGRPQQISDAEQDYRLTAIWQPSIYSSTSVILFVDDPEDTSPDTFYAVDVSGSVVGDAIGQYQLGDANATPSAEMVEAAEAAGLHPDLTFQGQRYLIVDVFVPAGTTTNGFVTLFSNTGEGNEPFLLGRDLRKLELFFYTPVPQPGG